MKKQALSLFLAILMMLSALLSLSSCNTSKETNDNSKNNINTTIPNGTIIKGEKMKFVGEIVILSTEINPDDPNNRYIFVKPTSNTGDLVLIKLFYDASKISDSDFEKGKIIEFSYYTYSKENRYQASTITVIDDSATTTVWEKKLDSSHIIRENNNTSNNYGTVLHTERITGSLNGYLLYVKCGTSINVLWVEDNYTVLDSKVEELIREQATGYKIDVCIADYNGQDFNGIIRLAHSLNYSTFNK